MPVWAVILLSVFIVIDAVFVFLGAPALVIYIAVFGRKKAVPFEQYDQEKFKDHYYYPYVKTIGKERERMLSRPHTEVSIKSCDGLTLYGDYYDQGKKRTAILFHGLNAEVYTNESSQANFFYDNGFNVLLVCSRAHGKSGGRHTTIGIREQNDVLSWTDWAEKQGAEQVLLYGLSMGASAIAYASDKLENTKVCGMILDSCYYSIYEQMWADSGRHHIPGILVYCQRFLAKLFLRIDIKTDTASYLSRSKRPVLFIQGTADLTVEPKWGGILYEACAEPKEYLPVEGGHHTLSYLKDSELTGGKMLEFINKYFK